MTDPTITPEPETDLDGDPTEVVAAVWAGVLELDDVDPEAGFFDLGATSAMVVEVVRVLRRRWPGSRSSMCSPVRPSRSSQPSSPMGRSAARSDAYVSTVRIASARSSHAAPPKR